MALLTLLWKLTGIKQSLPISIAAPQQHPARVKLSSAPAQAAHKVREVCMTARPTAMKLSSSTKKKKSHLTVCTHSCAISHTTAVVITLLLTDHRNCNRCVNLTLFDEIKATCRQNHLRLWKPYFMFLLLTKLKIVAVTCFSWYTEMCVCILISKPTKVNREFPIYHYGFSLNPLGLTFTGASNWAGTSEIRFMQLLFPFVC